MKVFLAVATVLSLSLSARIAEADVIYSDPADGVLEARGDTVNDLPPSGAWPQIHPFTNGNFEGAVGEWYGMGPDGPSAYGMATLVLPFELPNFGAVADPFTFARLGVMSNGYTNAGNTTDIDLYGLSRVSSDPTIQTGDWYNGSAPDPTATLIQESFLTPSSRFGWDYRRNNFTNFSGNAALVDFLNEAYADGANAGHFVFLRLSYGADTFATGPDNYNICLLYTSPSPRD